MVGRARELGRLREWLDAARAGSGRLVLCVGEAGIGKTRLAQEFAGSALAAGAAVAWGRCVETEGAPAYWPWRQILKSLSLDPDKVLTATEDRFRLYEELIDVLRTAAGSRGLVVILDDVHRGDEPSLLVLRQLADQLADLPILVLATCRESEPSAAFPRFLPDLLQSRSAERLDLSGFGLDETREQLPTATERQLTNVHEITGGNPLFVREVARAIADGTWQEDRPPKSVLDLVAARLRRVSPDCCRLVQAAAIIGRDFRADLLAATLAVPVGDCLPLIDEAITFGFVDQVGAGEFRFVHALTRDAIEASCATADRANWHRGVAEALEDRYGHDLSEHLADIARHRAQYGETKVAAEWMIRAAEDAVRKLAYEEGVRLYKAALKLNTQRDCRTQIALGKAAYLAGDLQECVKAAMAAAEAAPTPELKAEAALILEAVPDPGINAGAKRLCEEALAVTTDTALRARLTAQRSHLAFYDGEQERLDALSREALALAHASRDDHALTEALRARQEACPGPAGRAERLLLATEMLDLAQRTDNARAAMWGELWRLDALIESGRLAAASAELPALKVAVDRVGGPVSAWHHDRVAACVAQARGQYAEAATIARRGFDRMRLVERAPATGAYFALQIALAGHVGVHPDAAAFASQSFDPPPRFATMALLSRAYLLMCMGRSDEADASYRQAGPIESWSLPAFFVLPGYVYAALASAGLRHHDDLALLIDRLQPFRGEHAVGNGVASMGPAELAIGRAELTLGRFDAAIEDLTGAVRRAESAGAPGFVAEAQFQLATALAERDDPGDRKRAKPVAEQAARLIRSLGMTPYAGQLAALFTKLDDTGGSATGLSPREAEVAGLVAEGLTNRQIAERLVISDRTAQNHVQHILTKLGFANRSQIATWTTRTTR
ncbi:AAA family ATPase [Kribbella qitaiheensis]|uniref:AAA family ATPase n=2 Tax=Kribbella qitaiheensis TaxID=1544730 RepID=A0A7G6X9K2_9ACTN|nr:AAA family ATPase [Kribbella qitaiheensis]